MLPRWRYISGQGGKAGAANFPLHLYRRVQFTRRQVQGDSNEEGAE